VLGGAFADGGMASFKDILTKNDVEAIHAYVLSQAHALWDAKKGKDAPH
jgi:mono/diheme cytochrome c family protein